MQGPFKLAIPPSPMEPREDTRTARNMVTGQSKQDEGHSVRKTRCFRCSRRLVQLINEYRHTSATSTPRRLSRLDESSGRAAAENSAGPPGGAHGASELGPQPRSTPQQAASDFAACFRLAKARRCRVRPLSLFTVGF